MKKDRTAIVPCNDCRSTPEQNTIAVVLLLSIYLFVRDRQKGSLELYNTNQKLHKPYFGHVAVYNQKAQFW